MPIAFLRARLPAGRGTVTISPSLADWPLENWRRSTGAAATSSADCALTASYSRPICALLTDHDYHACLIVLDGSVVQLKLHWRASKFAPPGELEGPGLQEAQRAQT